MDAQTALELIRPLADGVDPLTGETLAEENICQHPQIVRALMSAIGALEFERERRRRQQKLPGKAWMAWSSEEDEALADQFESGKSLQEIADAHERTKAAIQARLIKIGKLSAELATPLGRATLRPPED